MRSPTHDRKNTVAPQNSFKSTKHKFWNSINIFAILIALLAFVLSLIAIIFVNKNTPSRSLAGQESESIAERLQSNIDYLSSEISKATDERKQIESKIRQLSSEIKNLMSKVNSSWKKGCPQNGLTNGDICFVQGVQRANYSQAVKSCSDQGGNLALIRNTETLKAVTSAFPSQPFLVNAHFDETSNKWKTTLGEEADFLPWSSGTRGSDGKCVYAFRSDFKQWHCHAQLEYLCSF